MSHFLFFIKKIAAYENYYYKVFSYAANAKRKFSVFI